MPRASGYQRSTRSSSRISTTINVGHSGAPHHAVNHIEGTADDGVRPAWHRGHHRAAVTFLKVNADIRTPTKGAPFVRSVVCARDIVATAMPAQAFADDRVKVTSVENTHFPVVPKRR